MKAAKKVFLLITLFFFTTPVFAQIKLPKLISDGMILQRNEEINIWGWAAPGEEVKLSYKDSTFHTTADTNGDWKLLLPAQNAGGPYEMVFEASNEITVDNILFGDVWVCSGQSNMELMMERVKYKYSTLIQQSGNPNIRQFLVPDKYDFKKEYEDFDGGEWQSANPETVLGFSAVAYFFAKELYEQYQVPIGLINSSLGGSPVEAWMSEETLKQFPDAYNELQKFKDDSLISRIQKSDQTRSDQWYNELNSKDAGVAAVPAWSQPEADDADWEQMNIPGYWSDKTSMGDENGVVWFRKEVIVPKSMTGKTAKLWAGRIVDQDYVYVNGELVGTTGYQYPPRRYMVDSTLLKEGKNIIAIRVINNSGKGGFVLDKPYYLAAGKDTIDLKGAWRYKLGATMDPLASQTFIRWKPGGLYNRMITPLFNYGIKGAIWYQGESNTSPGEPSQYAGRFSAMIKNWRSEWNQGDFPFLFVQLANFLESYPEPTESGWAELRQAQLNTLGVSNTGMAVIIDLGEWNDVHPLNKEDVGKRLALQARKVAYEEGDVVASGPLYKSSTRSGNKIILSFSNTGSGLIAKGGDLKGFAVAGSDGNFVWADARIEGDKVVIWHEGIEHPEIIRYAWANNPDKANLYNKEGLPASPFEIHL